MHLIDGYQYESLFNDNPTLKKFLETNKSNSKKLFDLLITQKKSLEDEAVSDVLLQSSPQTVFMEYCKERGLIYAKFTEAPHLAVTLVTDPPNGKIYMLSALEYELAKMKGKDADAELMKSVVAKTDPANIAGVYYYCVEWPDNKRSKIGRIDVGFKGTYTLK